MFPVSPAAFESYAVCPASVMGKHIRIDDLTKLTISSSRDAIGGYCFGLYGPTP